MPFSTARSNAPTPFPAAGTLPAACRGSDPDPNLAAPTERLSDLIPCSALPALHSSPSRSRHQTRNTKPSLSFKLHLTSTTLLSPTSLLTNQEQTHPHTHTMKPPTEGKADIEAEAKAKVRAWGFTHVFVWTDRPGACKPSPNTLIPTPPRLE
jgi:hypothetical protein